MKPQRWIEGPPPGPGRYWVVWRSRDGAARVEAVELSPALIHRNDPTADLLIKTLSGLAYQLAPNLKNLTHHMPLEAPSPPRSVVCREPPR